MVSLAEIRAEHTGVFSAECPTRTVLNHVTSKWGVLVLVSLSDGTRRWGQLRREVDGISEKMLASTLRTLEADGFVRRESHPVVPPHVDYSLTDDGREVVDRLLPLMEWIADHADAILVRSASA